MMWEAGEGSTESSSVAAGVRGSGSSIGIGVTGGRRKPSWRERENNRRRERRRRAIASQIYAGLRAQGNFNLPKHCDNNEVLKALCAEAGWVVESDGTTYRKGSKPVPMEIGGTSANVTPCSSRNPSPPSSCFASPIPSYVPSPLSSACPSPTRFERSMPSNYPYAPFHINAIPPLPPLRISNSAPVSPPPRSPSRHHPLKQDFNLKTHVAKEPETPMFSLNYPFKGVSAAPMSPIRGQRVAPPPPAPIPECDESDTSTNESLQWMNFEAYGNDVSPTFNLVKPVAQWMPFGGGGNADADADADVSDKGKSEEFGFENAGVNAWKGERVQNVGMEDDLELTLGSKNARV